MNYIIYLRTNKINGKQYVGQTNNFDRRQKQWNCLKWDYANKYLSEDRNKYGLENFETTIIDESENKNEAWELEKIYIKKYNTKFPNGYNLSDGGRGRTNCFVSDETRMKISKAHKGKKLGKFTESHKQKIADSQSKTVYQYTLDGVLVEINKTSKFKREGYSSSNISRCCNGKRKTYKGYRWSYETL